MHESFETMRVVVGAPMRPLLASTPYARLGAPRADLLDDLKYQLSNSDDGSRPARDLVENPVAAAYLVVLLLFAGGALHYVFADFPGAIHA